MIIKTNHHKFPKKEIGVDVAKREFSVVTQPYEHVDVENLTGELGEAEAWLAFILAVKMEPGTVKLLKNGKVMAWASHRNSKVTHKSS